MIKLINISKTYKNKKVLNNITYEFNDSGLYFITGKSGSGKTTLLNIISSNIKPTSGTVSYSSIDSIYEDSYYIYQDFNLIPSLSVLDNIKLVLKIKNKIYDEILIKEKLESVGLIEFINSKTSNLSGGERQRLSIVIALILNSKVIFLDEPTSALDRENTNNIISYLRSLSSSTLIIIATHDLSLIKSDDTILNLDNFQSIDITNDETETKHKKINLKLNTLYVKHKMMKKDIIRLSFQVIFLTFLLISLTFVIPFSNMTYNAVSAKEIVNGSQNIIIYNGLNNSKKIDLMFNEFDLSKYSVNKGCHSDFDLSYNNITINVSNVFVEESLNNDEIILSSEVASKLSLTSSTNSIFASNNELKIADIESYKDISNTQDDFFLEYVKLNFNTLVKIDNYLLDNYKVYVNYYYPFTADNKLEIGTCVVSSDYYNNFLKDKNYKIGDIIPLTIIRSEKQYTKYLRLTDISDNDKIDKLSMYEIYKETDGSSYYSYNFSHLSDYNKTSNLVEYMRFNSINFYFNNQKSAYFVSQVFNGLDILLKVLIPILITFSIFLTIYISYNMFKLNKRSFNVLSLLGVSKTSILSICMIDHIECVIISTIISIYPIVATSNYFMNTLNKMDDYQSLSISFNIFEFKYLILSAIAIFITLLLISFIFNLLRSTKSSYINE